MTTFQQILATLGIGAVAAGAATGGYLYRDTEDRTDQYSRVGVENYNYSPLHLVDTWFLHHTAGGDLTQAALYHTVGQEYGGHGWDGIAYAYGFEQNKKLRGDYYLINTRPIDTKGNQASRNNTASRGVVVEGNFNDQPVSEDLIQEIETWLYATLKLYPNVNCFKPHNLNPWSKTECPGSKLEKAIKDKGLFFNDRSEIQWFMEKMDKRLRYNCDEKIDRYFENGEPC
jgi:hypothetical protein